jgi:integrase
LLLDHGLRVGEVARLQVSDFDLKAGEMRFYRPKVDKTQTHKLSGDTQRALQAWFESGDAPAAGPLLRASRKNGELTDAGMTEWSISQRVRTLGERIGLDGLSAHDCRHYWATFWADKVDVLRLQEAGSWSSLAMPRRYVEESEIANEGMA